MRSEIPIIYRSNALFCKILILCNKELLADLQVIIPYSIWDLTTKGIIGKSAKISGKILFLLDLGQILTQQFC